MDAKYEEWPWDFDAARRGYELEKDTQPSLHGVEVILEFTHRTAMHIHIMPVRESAVESIAPNLRASLFVSIDFAYTHI